MGRRRRARELALQLLFQIEVTRDPAREAASRFWETQEAPADVRGFAEELALGALERLPEIDAAIESSTEHWRMERMAAVDRNVLRVAVYELLHRNDVPPAVIIDEAIEIARKYGSDESGPFINGILDAIRKGVARSADGA